MATTCFRTSTLRAALALLTISLGISACERGGPPAPAGLFASRAAIAEGASLFAAHCALCHGVNGDGQGMRHAFMNPPPANLTLPPTSEEANAPRTFRTIRDGVPGTAMASWRMLTDQQIWSLVAYIHTLAR